MKSFIKNYLRLISYTVIGLVFLISSFYLVINYYHSEELKTTLYISEGDLVYQSFNNKLEQLEANLNKFNSKKTVNTSPVLSKMYNKLISCKSVLKSEGTLATLPVNTYFNPTDVYNLGSKYQSDILNICWALHLSYLTDDETVPKEFKEIGPYVGNSVNVLSNQVSFALSEIQNNSSYFYSTNITASTVRSYLNADYTMIAKAYNEFAGILVSLSETINEKVDNSNGGVVNE